MQQLGIIPLYLQIFTFLLYITHYSKKKKNMANIIFVYTTTYVPTQIIVFNEIVIFVRREFYIAMGNLI